MSSIEVALARCESYSTEAVNKAVRELVARLGGMQKFVSWGQSVLIKPNLLIAAPPNAGVTTHPEVIRAVIRLVKEAGGRPAVGDSPSSGANLEHVWETTGCRRICQEEGVALVNLEKAGACEIADGPLSFVLSRAVTDADAIINVPKVKTHTFMFLTAAVKNAYGAVPGFQKTVLHAQYPDQTAFGRLLAAIYRSVRPSLNIADAIEAMEGDGPSAGRSVRLGFLAASADGFALDAVICRILGFSARKVRYLRSTLNNGELRQSINVVGDDAAHLAPLRFQKPRTYPVPTLPAPISRMLARLIWTHPAVAERCTGCGTCVEACPFGALATGERTAKSRHPSLNASACRSCCCCQEVCPEHAITMRHSRLLNLILGRAKP